MLILGAVLTSALVGLLATPLMHALIVRSPMHLRLTAVPSHCSNCGTTSPGIQRIPLLACLMRRNDCRVCTNRLWPYAPWLELGTVALMGIAGWRLSFAPEALPAFWVFFVVAITITLIDLKLYLIPTRVVYPATAIGAVLLLIAAVINGEWDRLLLALAAMLGAWLFFFLFWLFFPAGIGFGDVRLALLVGLFTGWLTPTVTVLAVFLSLMIGAAVGVFLVVIRLKTMKAAVPYGPFMVGGATIAILFPTALGSLVGLLIGN